MAITYILYNTFIGFISHKEYSNRTSVDYVDDLITVT